MTTSPNRPGGWSRRSFLRTTAASTMTVTLLDRARGDVAPTGEAKADARMPVNVKLRINGRNHRLTLDGRTTLLKPGSAKAPASATRLARPRTNCRRSIRPRRQDHPARPDRNRPAHEQRKGPDARERFSKPFEAQRHCCRRKRQGRPTPNSPASRNRQRHGHWCGIPPSGYMRPFIECCQIESNHVSMAFLTWSFSIP